METTWLLLLDLRDLMLSSDTPEGPGVRSAGSGSVTVFLEKRVTFTMSPEETPVHKQTSSAPESRGTESLSPRGPIALQKVSSCDRNSVALPLEARKQDPSAEEPRVPGTEKRRELYPTNRKGKLIGQSPRRSDQSESRTAPSLSNVALAFQNRTLPGRQGRGGRRGRRAPCVPRVRRRIPARQPLRTGPPLRLRAGGGGSYTEGSRLAFPLDRG